MELKRGKPHAAKLSWELLIVPYGIETRLMESFMRVLYLLLIVPYGIETRSLLPRNFSHLLF